MGALAAILVSTLAVTPVTDSPPVPWFVPRGAAVGVFVNAPVVAPHLRLAWEAAFYAAGRDALVGLLALGTGFGLGVPAPMTEHFQHVLLAGLGYRNTHRRLHWGFQLGLGAVWYRAAYQPGSVWALESRVLGYAEGRGQLGLRLAPHLVLGLYAGYASPWRFDARYPGNTYLGGVDLGLFLDWR